MSLLILLVLFVLMLYVPVNNFRVIVLVFLSSVSLSLSHWYPGSGVVLDCIDS